MIFNLVNIDCGNLFGLTFGRNAGRMMPVDLVSLAVTLVVLWAYFHPSTGLRAGSYPQRPPVNELIQHFFNALILGGTYALLGIGLTLIFGITNVVNFTHGALYTVGAYGMYLAVAALGLNFFLALPVAILGGPLLGAAIELMLLRPFRGSDIDTTMLVMIGAGTIMKSGTPWTGRRSGRI